MYVNFRNNQDGETIVRTVSDCWVVGKKSDQREVFIVINQKNSNLIEVNGEYSRSLILYDILRICPMQIPLKRTCNIYFILQIHVVKCILDAEREACSQIFFFLAHLKKTNEWPFCHLTEK